MNTPPMKKGDMLFVYGSLRLGQTNDITKFGSVGNRVKALGESAIPATLYALGWYPGVKLGSADSRVHGDLIEILDTSITTALDAYEGHPHLFVRTKTKTVSGDDVWVYEYNNDVSSERVVPSGDWASR